MKNEDLDRLQEATKALLDALPEVMLDGNMRFRRASNASPVQPTEILVAVTAARNKAQAVYNTLANTPRRKVKGEDK